MEQLVLNQLKRLPEHLQIEALHYIQYLLFKEQERVAASSAPAPALSTDAVTEEERKRRMAIASRFEVSLKQAFTGYQPAKHERCEQ